MDHQERPQGCLRPLLAEGNNGPWLVGQGLLHTRFWPLQKRHDVCRSACQFPEVLRQLLLLQHHLGWPTAPARFKAVDLAPLCCSYEYPQGPRCSPQVGSSLGGRCMMNRGKLLGGPAS